MVIHLEEFQKETLTGYVESVPPQRQYLLQKFMPEQTVQDINFAYNVINGAYAKAASITGWNASAPLRDRKAIEKAYGELAKLQHSYRLDEKDLFSFEKPRTPEERQAVIDGVYTDTDDLIAGVDDTKEWLRAQTLYTGGVNYSDPRNDVSIEFQYEMPEANRLDVSVPWSDPASLPLTDLQAANEQFKKTNQRRTPIEMHMTSVTEAYLLQNEQIRTQVYGQSNGGRILTPADLQNVFRALKLPTYVINDDVIVMEAAEMVDGQKVIIDKEIQLLEDNKVVLLGDNLGNTMIGPSAEKGYATGKFANPIIHQNPPGEEVIVGESAFPAFKRPKAIVILEVA
ncbi:major capsid protein [Domibacillus enclensis]|uniref:Minor capsid protein E n=1 Tax=Domibacillus enclensis TaxID=1017273 RepID=A0A1N6WJ56_9BACI|nr:major capsid protein [Domibacillus enclensis]OXS77951.1 minor capsid protein E [Domibacillus enclensis]SIQ90111.1 Phage major capsid protein E [Domibacillus enclensis]